MINEAQISNVIGATAYGQDGEKIGKVGQLFLNDQSGEPEFVTVNTGLFGMNESYIPISQATLDGDRLVVPYTKDQVKDAPNVDVQGGHLDQSEEQRLYQHYGMGWDAGTDIGTDTGTAFADTGRTTGDVDTTVGHDTSGPTTDEAMTRSEEHLEVGTQHREAGRARLRKYVTTDTETVSVPVSKEHAVVEREPITDGNLDNALGGPAISEEEHEVVLHEERPVVETVAEPVERVRLGTETTREEETVSGEVRKEEIEVEGDVRPGDGGVR